MASAAPGTKLLLVSPVCSTGNTSNPDIALLEFVPDKTAKTLTLRGSARDVDALTTYLDALAKESAFREVYLSHQKKIPQGAMSVIGFEIKMQLRQ